LSLKLNADGVPQEGLSHQGKQVLRRFRVIYVSFRVGIYVLIWGSLAGGLPAFEGNHSLLMALVLILTGFIGMRLLSTAVFEQPNEKLSLFLLRLTFFFSFCFAFHQAGISEPSLGSWSLTMGVTCWGLGIVLWWRARSRLDPHYYDVVHVQKEQCVCSEGVYEHLRHPGYCAEALSWVGGIIMLDRFWPAVIVPILLVLVFGYRMWIEEKILQEHLEGYAAYCQSVKRFKFF
jgi:protein-S-isoprenylcysteine O-methyltransferase Ste14